MSASLFLKRIQNSIGHFLKSMSHGFYSDDKKQKIEKKQLMGKKKDLQHTNRQIRLSEDSVTPNENSDLAPDLFLDVPQIKTEQIKLALEDLDAHVALQAELSGMVKINVGVSVGIKKLDLDIKGLDLNALLKVKLQNVHKIFSRTLESLDKNPDILKNMDTSGSNTKEKKKIAAVEKEQPEGKNIAQDTKDNNFSSIDKDVSQKKRNIEQKEESQKENMRDDTFTWTMKNEPNERNQEDARTFENQTPDKTYEEVEEKKNGVEKLTKIILSPAFSHNVDTQTATGDIKRVIEGSSSVKKNIIHRLFRVNR